MHLPKPPFPTSDRAESLKRRSRLSTPDRDSGGLHAAGARLTLPPTSPKPSSRSLIGDSSKMRRVTRQIDRLGQADIPVFVRGESGTGKELAARAIHDCSRRRAGPFVTVNCPAIPEALQESLLFGHHKGSFTGATERHRGSVERANGGTLFLDEVAELSPSLQSKLLRVLQERRFEPVGGTTEIEADFRLIAATHQDLKKAVRDGRFREDLYFRIVVFELEMPPLRERVGDIVPLARHFLQRHAEGELGWVPTLGPSAVEVMERYGWPGNVRELENVIQRALVSCEADAIEAEDLNIDPKECRRLQVTEPPPAIREQLVADEITTGSSTAPGVTITPDMTLAEIERRAIEMMLLRFGGNRELVAKQLGIGRTTLYRRLKSYGLLSPTSDRVMAPLLASIDDQ